MDRLRIEAEPRLANENMEQRRGKDSDQQVRQRGQKNGQGHVPAVPAEAGLRIALMSATRV